MKDAVLIESIKLEDGVFHHLDFHSKRMNDACANLGIEHNHYNLEDYLSKFDYPTKGLYKCLSLIHISEPTRPY